MGSSESQVDGEVVGTATVIAPINEEDEDPYPESRVANLYSDSYNVTGPNMTVGVGQDVVDEADIAEERREITDPAQNSGYNTPSLGDSSASKYVRFPSDQ